MTSSQNIDAFLAQQLQAWPKAADNYAALKNVRVREFDVDGWPIRVQFNPGRIVSSGAKVDKASLAARPCFLCEKNRPAEQIKQLWGDGNRYELLINPFPIFPRHFTIPACDHTPQTIMDGRMRDMIDLASQLTDHIVFYNGPKCGASAPDHMHFQAGNADFLTIAQPLAHATQQPIKALNDSTLSLITDLPMPMFVIDAATAADGAALFEALCQAMPMADDDTEPMMNVLAMCSDPQSHRVTVIVIPRLRHRPSFYGTQGGGAMLISPASVDMGGTFITPLEADFERLDAEIVRRIFDELVISKDQAKQIAANVK